VTALQRWLDPLRSVVAPEPVDAAGAWTTKRRTTYASPAQLESGAAPTGHVEDHAWTVSFTASEPVAAIAFFESRFGVRWVKSNRASINLQGALSLAGWTGSACTIMVNAWLHGACSDGVPLGVSTDPRAQITVTPRRVTTGEPTLFARIEGFACVAVLLPEHQLQMGRNGLWHLRAQWAAQVPAGLRTVLTRRRCGRWTDGPPET
jgi:hypothetical protein